MAVQVDLSTTIYPRECVQATIEAYAGLCDVTIREATSLNCSIEITGTTTDAPEATLVHEFLNYLLDLSLESHLSKF